MMIEMIDKKDMEEIDLVEVMRENDNVSMILFEEDAEDIINELRGELNILDGLDQLDEDFVILSRVGDSLILEPLLHGEGVQYVLEADLIYYDVEIDDLIDFEMLYANEIIDIEFDKNEEDEIDEMYTEIIEELLDNYEPRQAMFELARIAYADGRKTLALELKEDMDDIVEE